MKKEKYSNGHREVFMSKKKKVLVLSIMVLVLAVAVVLNFT